MMSEIPGLEMLVDAFPHYPRSELASRLLCCSSVETLFNELAVENSEFQDTVTSSTTKSYHEDVARLKNLFPRSQKDDLAAVLHRNNGCLDKTIENLLEHEPIQKLAQVTKLDESDLAPYLARNQNHVLRALADVISHYKKRKRVRASRVQARNGSAATYQDAYTLHENSTEYLQLMESVWAEAELRSINFDFLRKSLIFFQGDVPCVLNVACLYIEAACQSITFDRRLGFQTVEVPDKTLPSATLLRGHSSLISPKPMGPKLGEQVDVSRLKPTIVMPKYNASARVKSPSSGSTNSTLINGFRSRSPIYLMQPNQRRISPQKKNTLTPGLRSSRLDLHGFTVAEAIPAVNEAVSEWWAEETDSRTSEGHIDRYGSKAQFVEPLHIITGRGIHSAGGAPKIRSSVIKLLTQEGYVIDEFTGSVAVLGRRPKKIN